MRITNLADYDAPPSPPLQAPTKAGVTSKNLGDPATRGYVEAVVDALRRSGDLERIVYPYSPAAHSDGVDLVIDLDVSPRYSGQGSNFLVNFPGFLLFAPAIWGYGYKADVDTTVSITHLADGSTRQINVPVHYKFRQAEIDRTWTEIGWLEVGLIPLIGGLAFTQYDEDVTPEFVSKVSPSYGKYVANKIRDAL